MTMKDYFMNLFEIEEDEINSKDIAKAAVSLLLSIGILFVPLFI